MKKVAIVTGASRGIGAATAKLLAANNFAVCVNYNSNKEKADAVVSAIKEANGHAIAVKANIASEIEILELFKAVDEQLGPVTALINNAGMNGGICNVEDLSTACLKEVFATNVFGVFFTCREALKRMKQQGGGRIVNISSEAGRFGGHNMAHYAASKAAVNIFTVAFAREAGQHNVTVNTISPGIIDTDMYNDVAEEKKQALKKAIPLGRMGKPEEIAQSILWLLSDQSAYLNGAIIPVAGGR